MERLNHLCCGVLRWVKWTERNVVKGGCVVRYEQHPPKRNEWSEWTYRKHKEIKLDIFFLTATIEREEGNLVGFWLAVRLNNSPIRCRYFPLSRRGLVFGQRSGAKRWFCAAIIHNDSLCVFFQGISPSVASLFGEKAHITKHYVYIALSCFFSGASAARWWRLECKRLFCLLQKVWQKKTTAGLIERKPTKRPCKPRGTRGGDFWRLGIWPAELPVIY